MAGVARKPSRHFNGRLARPPQEVGGSRQPHRGRGGGGGAVLRLDRLQAAQARRRTLHAVFRPPQARQRVERGEQGPHPTDGGGGKDDTSGSGEDRRGEGRRLVDPARRGGCAGRTVRSGGGVEETGARARWDAFPRSAKRGILEWIAQAKTSATRERRVRETAILAARGERANQWRRRS
ncbi:YdeI/OmpD-associated family protein [Deinococcus sp. YIM 134068]|uniref:YdeI/OmpD-associated family protein n=1 Tax=Deinococcus lichenicola TaxID=3118910 RepID=UPI002F939A30